jgi:hypothetical protein
MPAEKNPHSIALLVFREKEEYRAVEVLVSWHPDDGSIDCARFTSLTHHGVKAGQLEALASSALPVIAPEPAGEDVPRCGDCGAQLAEYAGPGTARGRFCMTCDPDPLVYDFEDTER